MDPEMVEKLIAELNITRLALGQVICNDERQFGSVSPKSIAQHWLARAPEFSREEWIAGTESLIHHFLVTPSASSDQAIAILSPTETCHATNSKLFRGIHYRRGRHKNKDTFEAGKNILKNQYGFHNHGDDSTQLPRCDKGGISVNSHKNNVWKSIFSRFAKWLQNPKKANATL